MVVAAGSRVSHYRLIDKLGEGGMGVVWRAHDESLDREIAVKFLPEEFADDPERRARFEREAKAVAALNHPNIVTIYSVEEVEGHFFFTMELVQGESLSRIVPEDGLPFERVLDLAIPLAGAINAAHERGIIHRDLKPDNVMLAEDGLVKILDFGLAQFRQGLMSNAASHSSATTVRREEGISGTIRYMSPEQIRGETPDHRTDLFSFGVILFQMSTGRLPFLHATAADALASILKDAPLNVDDVKPELPRQLSRIVARCLEKPVRRRTQSALDLRNELEQLKHERVSMKERYGPSIAVLPFVDMSPERDQEYFCEGMAEEILNALSRIRGLRVASRTSSFRFRDATADSRDIGRRLRVGTLLEGSVRRSGGRLRISAQLVDVDEGYHLWSERYDRELTDVFDIQDEIARSIAGALQVTLTAAEKGEIQKTPTRDVQAYDYYLRGRKFYYQFGRREIEFALQLFSRAIELDPDFALAWAGLADCWSFLFMYSERSDTSREQAETASGRAIELDPESAQAQASRGVALSLSRRDDEAEQAFETAIRLDPTLFEAYYFYARHCFVGGDLEKAARMYQQATKVFPDDYQARLLVAQIFDELGRPADAKAARRTGIEVIEKHLELNPDDARALYLGANGLVALGEVERGLEWAGRALEMAPEEPMLLYNVGCIYSLAGHIDDAVEVLERAVANGLTQKRWFENDNNLDPLREHPRFRALMERLDRAKP
jgi:non-specific serine/threonine protein kinase